MKLKKSINKNISLLKSAMSLFLLMSDLML